MFVLYLCVISLIQLHYGVAKVVLVQLLFRHGDRSAIHTYPNNPISESDWPQGYGQLSKIGMQQQYRLGQQLRQRYGDLLGPEYVNKQIYVRSTDVDRTLMSAYSDLAGLFQPDAEQTFQTGVRWQPIPVHTLPEHIDFVLAAQDVPCPRYDYLRQQALQSASVQTFLQDNKDFMETISSKTGVNIGLISISELWDTLFCQSQHQMLQPDWLNDTVMNKLYQFAVMKYKAAYASFEMKKLRGGVLINKVIDNFVGKSTGSQDLINRKIFMYSAHDTTLVSMLNALGTWDKLVPPYASCIMMELHQDTGSNQYYVQLYYQKGPETQPKMLEIPGCSTKCPVDQFAQLYKNIRATESEMQSMCNSGLSIVSDQGVVWMCGALLVLVVALTFVLRRRRLRRNNLSFPEKLV